MYISEAFHRNMGVVRLLLVGKGVRSGCFGKGQGCDQMLLLVRTRGGPAASGENKGSWFPAYFYKSPPKPLSLATRDFSTT